MRIDGNILKYIITESVCMEKMTMLFSCPKINCPRNNIKNPIVSKSQARNVIWMFNMFLRCLLALWESFKFSFILVMNSLWFLKKFKNQENWLRLDIPKIYDCKFVYLTKIVFSTYLVRCEKSRLYIKPSDMLNPMTRNNIASTIFSIFLKIYVKPLTNMRGLSSLVSQNFLCRTRKVDVSTKNTLWWYP